MIGKKVETAIKSFKDSKKRLIRNQIKNINLKIVA